MIDYYSKLDFKYPEICISKEKFNVKEPGLVKFYIPTLMPFIKEDKPKTVKVRPTKTHLLNKDKDTIKISENCKIANYVEVDLPESVVGAIKNYKQKIRREDIIPMSLSDMLNNSNVSGDTSPSSDEVEIDGVKSMYYNMNEETQTEVTSVLKSDIDSVETSKDGTKLFTNELDKPKPDNPTEEVSEKFITTNKYEVTEKYIKDLDITDLVPVIPLISKRTDTEYIFQQYDEDKYNGSSGTSSYEPCIIPAISVLNILEPEYFLDVDNKNMVEDDQSFVIVFIGGDINNKKIIGRY